MADVTLLWFACKNADCNYVSLEAYKRNKKAHVPLNTGARKRIFMRYVEGHYERKDNGNLMFFNCKYGRICMYDQYNTQDVNSFLNPVVDKEICDVCRQRVINDKVLFNE